MSSSCLPVSWSDNASSVWGKTLPLTDEWLPLVSHLADAANTMANLWENQPAITKRPFTKHFGSDLSARRFLMFLAAVHDVGKASSWTLKARKLTHPIDMTHLVSSLEARGVTFGAAAVPNVRHGAIGQVVLEEWLQERGWRPNRATRLACIVGGHHGDNPSDSELRELADRRHSWDSESMAAIRAEIINKLAVATGADEELPSWSLSNLPIELQMISEGLVIQADWIASNTDLFPLSGQMDSEARSNHAWHDLDLALPWTPCGPEIEPLELFRQRFPALAKMTPNATQLAMLNAASTMPESGLLVLEAPMGSGKTEAAFMAAEVLAARFGCGGVFIGLPTMATANPMFSRALQWLEAVPTTTPSSISLAHSKAALNTAYRGLMEQARASSMGDFLGGKEMQASATLVHEWCMGRKKTILANHVVGTIDQALFAALKAKHVVLRHLGLHNKVVIIDEVHAADRYMRVYLERLLTWLGRYETPTILMSATLPKQQRQALIDAYLKGGGNSAPQIVSSNVYPRITVATSIVSEIAPADTGAVTPITLELGSPDVDFASSVKNAIVDGGCVGIIRNTVRSAQETYAVLREALPEVRVMLAHSRFVAPHRMAKETELVSILGRNGERPSRVVVVGTQVLEQSLDVDFDLLITDLAPVDLIMQRMGRLHRHHRDFRPPILTSARCIIVGPEINSEGLPDFPRAWEAIYGAEGLLRSLATLFPNKSATHIEFPAAIVDMVNRAYDSDFEPPPEWGQLYAKACDKAAADNAESIRRAKEFLLPGPATESNLNGLISTPASDPEDANGYRQVRDSEDSLEVVVLQRGVDGTLRVLEGIGENSGMAVPFILTESPSDQDLARSVASCTIPLPLALTHPGILDQVIAHLESAYDCSGWQGSPWLKGQLCLILDADGRANDFVRPLSYSADIGLVVEAERKEEAK